MKIKRLNKVLLFGLVATMLFAVVGLSGCSPRRHPYSDPAISTELEIQIRQDYVANGFAGSVDDIRIWRYYGTFNNASVIIMSTVAIHGLIWAEEVAGVIFFTLCRVIPIRVWRERVFYTLTEAYDYGWLTVNYLKIIADKNNDFWYSYGFDFR